MINIIKIKKDNNKKHQFIKTRDKPEFYFPALSCISFFAKCLNLGRNCTSHTTIKQHFK